MSSTQTEDLRFEFGENWRSFLEAVDDNRIAAACDSLRTMLHLESLDGLAFLDIGCGSGLFSLAAALLGAERVHSFDVDPASVECCRTLQQRYMPEVRHWTVGQASALDEAYIGSLGSFDVVYSWGVLHHTGDMQRGLANAALPVAPGGFLFISIYNDQGFRSRMWRRIKELYNRLPRWLRIPYIVVVMLPRELFYSALAVIRRKQARPRRGMSRWHDLVDWVGGYPFEVAKPETIFSFFRARGFDLLELKTCGGRLGCNEFVFQKSRADA